MYLSVLPTTLEGEGSEKTITYRRAGNVLLSSVYISQYQGPVCRKSSICVFFFFFLILFYVKILHNCISFAKYQNVFKLNLATMVFPVVMYGCKSWTTEKAERRRIDAFELWYWRRLLRVPWTARRSNQSILKEISPGCSLEGLMLKLNSNTLVT